MLVVCNVLPSQTALFSSLPDSYKCGKSLGPVESLQEHPQHPDKILIGYSRGLVVLWSFQSRHVDNLFLGKQVCVWVKHLYQMAYEHLLIIWHLCRHKHLTTVTPAPLEAKLYVDHNMAKIYIFVLWVACITFRCVLFEFRWLFVLCVLRLQQLESLVWVRSGNSFVSSHSDGGYMVWPVSSSSFCTNEPISSTIPYGEPVFLVFSK